MGHAGSGKAYTSKPINPMKTNPLVTLIFSLIFLVSCTEAFQNKNKVAEEFVDDMKASGVTVGYAANTSAGKGTSKVTTLTFNDVTLNIEDLEENVNEVALKFYNTIPKEDLKGETALEIVTKMKDGEEYTFNFPLKELAIAEELLKNAEAMVQACHDNDSDKIRKLKDDDYLPDDVMADIYTLNADNAAAFSGQTYQVKRTGFRFASGEDDPDLRMVTANFAGGNKQMFTDYTVNVDCKTKKVVYIWMKNSE
jgi:hypothetical protein